MKRSSLLFAQLLAASVAASRSSNSTFFNPTIPGWNPDPSCIYVNDGHFQDTHFCATSTFLAFPGLPIYASKDLINWRHASNVWTRESQLPLPNADRNVDDLQSGFYAPNLRYRDGTFFLTNLYLTGAESGGLGTIFTTTDPFDSSSWSDDPLTWNPVAIDPELFWDKDGSTGNVSAPVSIWNGTTGTNPEGPHIYIKDDWYYLVIAEGGTSLGHSVTIARSRNLYGPYEDGPDNPYLSATGTDNYFQTVGHFDLFTDSRGQWWSMGLATRGGPEWVIHPMGRETVLTPVTWEFDEYPRFDPIKGIMQGWPLPPSNRDIAGEGPFAGDGDVIDFLPGSQLPPQLVHFRYPEEGTFTVAPEEHPESLRIRPARVNLTGVVNTDDASVTGARVSPFRPTQPCQEAGITAFLTQHQHTDLGIVLSNSTTHEQAHYDFLLRQTSLAESSYDGSDPTRLARSRIPTSDTTTRIPMPQNWAQTDQPITLELYSANETHYAFSAWPSGNANARQLLGYVPVTVTSVSDRVGQFLGTLLGFYATCNGAGDAGETRCPGGGEAYFEAWRYQGVAQRISDEELVPTIAWA
ncbi:hypothetical protein MBLNU230_g3792t1 [Neophaeotheca triangularis]